MQITHRAYLALKDKITELEKALAVEKKKKKD